jgi:capsid protein
MLMTLPAGYKMSQLQAEQPSTTYDTFKKSIIQEIARCLEMPLNIAAGDSSSYNFASGRLDHQLYGSSIWIERQEAELVILDKLFREWMREASLLDGYLPQSLRRGVPEHNWQWDALALDDQLKAAKARDSSLRNGATTLVQVYAEDGLDAEDELAAEAALLGVSLDEYKRRLFDSLHPTAGAAVPPEDKTDAEEDDKDQ